MREWITSADPESGNVYLVRFTDHASPTADIYGWQRADFAGLLDILAHVAWAEFTGEDCDSVTPFLLTDLGLMPVKVTQEAWDDVSVRVTVTFREPGKRGKAAQVEADKGFRRRIGD